MPRIKEDLTHTIEIKKSRFITYLHRTDSEEEARDLALRFSSILAVLTMLSAFIFSLIYWVIK